MTAKVYIVGQVHNRGDRDAEPPALRAVRAYASARGWPNLSSEQYVLVSKPGENLSEVLSTLSKGDLLLIESVGALSERPSEQERIVRSLIGAGVRLHTVELGPLEPFLPGMFQVWDAAVGVEKELDQALADMSAMEARHAEDLTNFQETLYSKIMSDGLTLTLGGKANGNGRSTPEGLGETIRAIRAKRNMSQRQLAEAAGLSGHSAIQRLEETGKGEGLSEVMKVLGIEEHHASA